jgi:hypothetical protein
MRRQIMTSPASGQATIPDGVFVKDAAGQTWLVLKGQRVGVPVWQATDADIAAIPLSDQWAVMSVTDQGAMVAGSKPAWLDAQAVANSSTASTAPAAPASAAPPSDREVITNVAGQQAVGKFGRPDIRVTVKEMTVLKTLPEAPPRTKYEDPTPAVTAQGKFVVVLVSIENIGTEPACCLPGFKLQDSRGRSFSGQTNRADGKVGQAMRTIYPFTGYSGDLQPGLPVENHVLVYDVPVDAQGFKIAAP